MDNDIPAKGRLKDFSFPQTLTYLYNKQRTGILTLENNKDITSIYLRDGNAVFASSSRKEYNLGEMLVLTGKITTDQYNKSVEVLKLTGKHHGAILVDLGYLTPEEHSSGVKRQIKEIILSIFLWEDGDFSFKETPPYSDTITLDMKIEILIREGTEREERKREEVKSSFIKKINEMYQNIDDLNYYELLNIPMKASSSEIKKAYVQMAKIYHPDVNLDLPDPFIKDKLTALFTLLNKAYITLNDEIKKKKYDKSFLKQGQKKDPDENIRKAEVQFIRGIEEFKKGNFWGAVESLEWAVKLNSQNAAYWAQLSLVLHKMPNKNKEAEKSILKAIALDRYNSSYYVHLGNIYLNVGMKKRAAQQFKTALDFDPTNQKAQTELEKLEN